MKVIVDNKIPYIREAIELIADEVVFLPGKEFEPALVKDADALIIRTRTHCGRELLEGSSVRFIATATIGYDHIDTDYCAQAGITWANAPGCNSGSVAQYIESCLLILEKEYGYTLKGMTIGIVGAGNVGRKVSAIGHKYGMRVLLNDPPREAAEGTAGFVSLSKIAGECDIISFHTPLNKAGRYTTYHLADDRFFGSLKRSPVLINTSRGEVVDTDSLLKALASGKVKASITDVWEHEPDIDRTLLERAIISTPHIAGYSADGKANATRMSLEALCRYFGSPARFGINPPEPSNPVIHAATEAEALLRIYNPQTDSGMLKAHPELFEKFRGDYPLRREKEAYVVKLNSENR